MRDRKGAGVSSSEGPGPRLQGGPLHQLDSGQKSEISRNASRQGERLVSASYAERRTGIDDSKAEGE